MKFYENAPTARHLNEQEQASYEEACKQFGEKARNSLNVSQKGSNLWKVLLLNQTGIKTASLEELGNLAEQNPEFLRGTYEDSPSVVLRSNGDNSSNDYLAQQLADFVGKSAIKTPIVISGLEIKADDSSSYGLSFDKGDRFESFEAPQLAHENHQKRFSKFDEKGMPIFDENGDKTLYTRVRGVSRLFLGRDLGLSRGTSSWLTPTIMVG